ncbi:helix-turn-helix domain-containing protein [Cellulosimicrobium funkei]|uniref:helix-turn-helix domain-containing protein n=1 Tax=Cellulosimicrobium funkei TaxID=264251 RepID=UPI0034422DAA
MAYWHVLLLIRYQWQLPWLLPTGMVTAMTATEINAEIASRVIAARRAKGMSRESLASETGISGRTLSRRESGKSAWTTDELAAIALALEIDIAALWVARDLAVSA